MLLPKIQENIVIMFYDNKNSIILFISNVPGVKSIEQWCIVYQRVQKGTCTT